MKHAADNIITQCKRCNNKNREENINNPLKPLSWFKPWACNWKYLKYHKNMRHRQMQRQRQRKRETETKAETETETERTAWKPAAFAKRFPDGSPFQLVLNRAVVNMWELTALILLLRSTTGTMTQCSVSIFVSKTIHVTKTPIRLD